MKTSMGKPDSKGFTIVELLVVIVVIGVLATIVIVAYTGITRQASVTSIKSDLKNASITLASDKATSDSDEYPENENLANGGLGLSASPGTEYEYDFDSISGEYCLSATSDTAGTSYYVSSDEGGVVKEGDCGGSATVGFPPAGGGLAFDGQEDYVRVASSASLNITNNLTIETWVYPSSVAADNDWRTVVGKLEGGTGGYEIGVESDQSLLYFDIQVPGGIVATDYTFPALDTWYHVVGTFQSGPTMKLYVNGALVDDAPQTYGGGPFSGNILTSSKPLYIGGDPMDSSYCPREFAGEVDEVRIYSRVLSDTEVGEHYAATFNNESNLVGLWHFEEGSGATIADSSGSNNNGVIIAPTGGSYAMSFDGSGDYITVPDSNSLDLTGEFTIEGWLKRDSVAQLSNWRLIIGKTNSSFPYDLYGWMTDTDFGSSSCGTSVEGQCSLGLFMTNSSGFWLSSPDSVSEWHHFVTTYNLTADRATIYWDYDSNGSDSAFDVPVGDGSLYIGGSGSVSDIAPYDFAGDLDELRLYGKELPANIVRLHLLGDFSQDGTGCGGASCNLRAYWGFNEGSGSAVNDASGNGNNGVISGNPQWISAEGGAQRATH